jgi:hypothetical protein
LLGYIEPDGKEGENNFDTGELIELRHVSRYSLLIRRITLCLAHPLAKGFKLEDGKVTFTVPKVKPKHNYIISRAYLMLILRYDP